MTRLKSKQFGVIAMWPFTKSSHTEEFSERIDVIRYFVQQICDKRTVGSGWAHLELAENLKFFSFATSGGAPFVEVMFGKADTLEVNLGYGKSTINPPEVPTAWQEKNDHQILLPLADAPVLVNWIDSYFNNVCAETPQRKLFGYLDGF